MDINSLKLNYAFVYCIISNFFTHKILFVKYYKSDTSLPHFTSNEGREDRKTSYSLFQAFPRGASESLSVHEQAAKICRNTLGLN